MPRDASGNYTLPLGNPVQGGTVIDVAWANPTMADIATQLNNVFTRDGLLGPLAPWKLIDGVAAAPSMTFNSELGMGLFRESGGVMGLALGGNVIMRWTATGFGTTESASVGKNLTVGGVSNVTGDSNVGGKLNVVGPIQNNGTNIAVVPPGTILDFAGPDAAIPAGYLVCRGQAVSRTTFAALFAAIGGYWGTGDGSTTFNVPDLQRYTTIGMGGSPSGWGPGSALASKGGNEQSALGVNELPYHTHGINQDAHAHSLYDPGHVHGVGDPGHVHATYRQGFWGSRNTGNVGWCSDDALSVVGTVGIETDARGTGIWIGAAATSMGVYAATIPINNQYAGGSWGFSNMQPSACVNKIIKT